SMACPVALSVGALIWSQNPGWKARQVVRKLFNCADPVDSLGCNAAYSGYLGSGRVNAFQAAISGDYDRDSDVDAADLAAFVNARILRSPDADLNFDGDIDLADLATFCRYFGRP
ncbi:MAG: hypothetical protein KJP07_15625, partial [Desulfatitalea sp.]|nr:hypothetical protein [Desulfatitalea sp.]